MLVHDTKTAEQKILDNLKEKQNERTSGTGAPYEITKAANSKHKSQKSFRRIIPSHLVNQNNPRENSSNKNGM